jgi:ribosome-binding factor A
MAEREYRPPSPRQLRVGEAIRHALAHALERGEIRDPGLGGYSATVTEVRVSPDLRHATAFVVPFGVPGSATPEAMRAVVAALNRATPYLRHRVAEAVRTKFAPEIVFRPDLSFDEAERIGRLFADPRVAQDVGRAVPPAGGRSTKSPRALKDAPLSERGRAPRRAIPSVGGRSTESPRASKDAPRRRRPSRKSR